MSKLMLNKNWQLHYNDTNLNTKIPFSVYSDLLNNGKIEDPYYRANEEKILPLSDSDYVYTKHFDFDCDKTKDKKEIYLHLDGVDTIADISINGEYLGQTDNMHCVFDYPVKWKLRNKDNVLEVHFHSPTKYIEEQNEKLGSIPSNTDTLDGFSYIRKSSCMFGWDWAPKLPDMGIYKEVSLHCVENYLIRDVLLEQIHTEGHVIIKPKIMLYRVVADKELSTLDTITLSQEETGCVVYIVTITDPEGKETIYEDPDEITIDAPKLWWPNGYGEQPLYTVTVDVFHEGRLQDSKKKRIGLRQMGIERKKDEWGESFAHIVNGVTIFAMGADYIPEDSLIPNITDKRTKRLLDDCKLANYNTIRVWGGGYYPNDSFYDMCDELGFIIWQDFMFTCSTYLLTEEFEANITKEIEQVVRRIRHHACLGLWCGNNEMEGMLKDGYAKGHPMEPRLLADYIKMYEYIIPKITKKEDPTTFYWPSSPSSGGSFDDPNAVHRGDAHYWSVWHGYKPFPEYRKHSFRYASEFGFESLPAMRTIESFTEEHDRNLFSYVMEKHQRSNGGNTKTVNYISQYFRYPESMERLVYISQMMQAEAMKYAVEHYRRNRGQCMGAVVWQLNDCWPVASWSSIDYYGRWKALHYYEKRFFAPVLVSCEEEGLLTQEPYLNGRPYQLEKSIRLNISNETREEKTVTVVWSIRTPLSEILGREQSETVTVPPLSAVYFEKVSLPEVDIYSEHVHYAAFMDGEQISEGTVIFSMPKYYEYEDPKLMVRAEDDTLIVEAAAYAKGVAILNEEDNLLLSDNYFDMEAGEKRIQILKGNVDKLQVTSVYE